MNSASARRPAAAEPLPRSLVARPSPSRRSSELRRRRRHMQQLRRDLLVDAGLALILTVLVLSATAGLGVVALLEMPVGAGVLLSFVLERRAGRSSRSTRRYRSPRPYMTPRRQRREGG